MAIRVEGGSARGGFGSQHCRARWGGDFCVEVRVSFPGKVVQHYGQLPSWNHYSTVAPEI